MQTQVYPVNAHLPKLALATLVLCLLPSTSTVSAEDGPPIMLHSAIGAGVANTAAHDSENENGKFFVGRLERVQKNNSKASPKRWALMDASNQVAAFVAPTTKFDLRRYLGSEIGVTAKTFSTPDGQPPYVLVEAITPISPMASNDWTVTSDATQSKTVLASHETAIPAATKIPKQAASSANTLATHGTVVPAQDWQTVVQPLPVVESVGQIGTCGGVGGCGNPTCQTCSTVVVSTRPCGPQGCGPPGWLWIRGENLQWWAKGMSTPPLVTTSNTTTMSEAGVLGANNAETSITSILFGGNDNLLSDNNSGFRIRFGGWFGPQRRVGYEGEFFSLTDNEEEFTASSDGTTGSQILGRPFFNINPRTGGNGSLNPWARQDAEIVAFPGLIGGTVAVSAYSDFRGASGMLRWNKCCKQGCKRSCCDPCCGGGCGCGIGRCGYPPFCKVDLLLGYQHFDLSEGISITEDLDASNQGTSIQQFDITDSYETSNEFHGAVFGTAWDMGINRWSLELMTRIAVGSVNQQVSIAGSTTTSQFPAGTTTTDTGGLLAQRTNIGTYDRTEFTMIPQLNANLGFYLTPHLRAVVGYTLIYWGNVVRPGDQIDLDVNPDLLPPEVSPFTGAERPTFNFDETDYWIQGLNIGLDFRW